MPDSTWEISPSGTASSPIMDSSGASFEEDLSHSHRHALGTLKIAGNHDSIDRALDIELLQTVFEQLAFDFQAFRFESIHLGGGGLPGSHVGVV